MVYTLYRKQNDKDTLNIYLTTITHIYKIVIEKLIQIPLTTIHTYPLQHELSDKSKNQTP